MNLATRELHIALIRLLKGVVAAWERWLRAQQQQQEPQSQHDSETHI